MTMDDATKCLLMTLKMTYLIGIVMLDSLTMLMFSSYYKYFL